MIFTSNGSGVDTRLVDALTGIPDDMVGLYVEMMKTLGSPPGGSFLEDVTSLAKEIQSKGIKLLKSKHVNNFGVFTGKKGILPKKKVAKDSKGMLLCFVAAAEGRFSFFSPRTMVLEDDLSSSECRKELKSLSRAHGKDVLLVCLHKHMADVRYLKFESVSLENLSDLIGKKHSKDVLSPLEMHNFVVSSLLSEENFESLLSVYLNKEF